MRLPEKDNNWLYIGRAEREIRRRCELYERADRDIPVQGEISADIWDFNNSVENEGD